MKYYSVYMAIGLGAWNLPLGTLARECSTAESDQTLHLTSPDQLKVFESCTTITGHIVVESSYLGDFILGGVTEFLGNISTEDDSPAPGLGSVELPDLVELGTINLGSVANVRLPKLEHAVDIVIVQPGSSGEVDLGSLVEANNDTEFCGSQNSGTSSDTEYPFISADLPALVTTNYLELAVSVESVSVPLLEAVGHQESGELSEQGLFINILEKTGKDLDFNAPKLHTLNGVLTIVGGVSGLSLGALEKGDVGITLNSRASPGLNVYSTIRIYLPNFDFANLDTASIAYLNDVPCNETLYNLWQVSPNPYDDNYCDEIQIRDEEPSDVGSDDTDDTTNEDTTTDEDDDDTSVGSLGDSGSVNDTDTQSGNNESTEEGFVPGDGAGTVLPNCGVALIMAAVASSWLSL
ncbi:hypothetical protein BJY00DRAFT_311801 [Aspergillus carlsbadensis]|nr:hypothetical protein BJY00DRAFT_311801 [Aspergillus carlsbadensis]